MIPVSLCWDTQKRSVLFKWDGLISFGWVDGKTSAKILGYSIFIPLEKKKIRLPSRPPIRWVYLKGFFSFITKWRPRKVEGALSFPDPMVNGILYGWVSALQTGKANRKIHVDVNFLGENWWRGEVVVSLKTVFHHFRSWIFPLIREIQGEKKHKKEVNRDGSH
jgi:hypothetical protein